MKKIIYNIHKKMELPVGWHSIFYMPCAYGKHRRRVFNKRCFKYRKFEMLFVCYCNFSWMSIAVLLLAAESASAIAGLAIVAVSFACCAANCSASMVACFS